MNDTVTDNRPYAVVADDDALIRMDVCDILADAGFRTFEARHADEALEILGEHHASIVLLFTDVEMPPGTMNGFALARKTASTWPQIGILVASGRAEPGPDDMPEGAHFVGKPFSADVVRARLKELLPDGRKPDPLKN